MDVLDYKLCQLVTEEIHVAGTEDVYDEEFFHIAYGADKNFSLGTAISIFSILKTHEEKSFHFHLFTDRRNNDLLQQLKSLATHHHFRLSLYLVESQSLHTLPVKAKWPCSIYFRIIAIDHLAAKVERLLYLDSDILCCASFSSLLSIDLQKNIVAAVADGDAGLMKERAISLKKPEMNDRYFNSGVMLINTASWRSENITQTIFEALNNPITRDALMFFDQDVINMAINGRVLLLTEKYNHQYSINDEYRHLSPLLPEDTVFLHYIGSTKPWHAWAKSYINTARFLHVKAASPWKNTPLKSPDKKVLFKQAFRHLTHQRSYISLVKYRIAWLLFLAG